VILIVINLCTAVLRFEIKIIHDSLIAKMFQRSNPLKTVFPCFRYTWASVCYK